MNWLTDTRQFIKDIFSTL